MSDCIVGIQKCGCITYANSMPEELDRSDERAITAIVRNGGRIERLDSETAQTLPDFLPSACPHDPKGWGR